MNPVVNVARLQGIGWLNLAATCRVNAVKVKAYAPALAASFLAEARMYLEWAAEDFSWAREEGWKLP